MVEGDNTVLISSQDTSAPTKRENLEFFLNTLGGGSNMIYDFRYFWFWNFLSF